MLVDCRLALKLAIFNTIGLLLAIVSPLYIDPKLKTHTVFPAAEYPLRQNYPNTAWAVALGFLCPVILASTFLLLRKKRTSGYLASFLPLAIPGSIAAFFLPPERPHSGILVWTFGYSAISLLTIFLRKKREDRYLDDPNLSLKSKLERLKATISAWQQIAVYGTVGYLAFVIFQISVVWSNSKIIVTDPREQFEFGNFCSFQIALYSILVVVGPLNEAFQTTFRSIERLSTTK
jgi:hypothetical protein